MKIKEGTIVNQINEGEIAIKRSQEKYEAANDVHIYHKRQLRRQLQSFTIDEEKKCIDQIRSVSHLTVVCNIFCELKRTVSNKCHPKCACVSYRERERVYVCI